MTRNRWPIVAALAGGLLLAAVAWRLAAKRVQHPADTSVQLAAPGKEVPPVVLRSRAPAQAGRHPKAAIMPEGSASHVAYPVFYGTNRLPNSQTGASSFPLTTLVSLAAIVALAIVAAARGHRAISFLLLAAGAGGAALALVPEPAKFNESAAEAFGFQAGELSVGVCTVDIPWDHQIGMLEAPSVLKFEFREDPDRDVVLERVDPLDYDHFVKDVRSRTAESAWPEALVYIHGYNSSFEAAARRAAQICYDIRFGGIAAMFSWPAAGSRWAYVADEKRVATAGQHLKRFLELLAKGGNLRRVHVIAHSMGNRCVLEALRRSCDLGSCTLDRCVFAAPDVDRDQFQASLAAIVGSATATPARIGLPTLYASAMDRALLASQLEHGHARAGDCRSGILLVDGLESVDASNLNTEYLGHSYVGNCPEMIADLKQMLDDRLPAARRARLAEKSVEQKKYWQFVPLTRPSSN